MLRYPVRVMLMPKVYIVIVIREFLFQVDKHCNNIIYTWVCVDCKSKKYERALLPWK